MNINKKLHKKLTNLIGKQAYIGANSCRHMIANITHPHIRKKLKNALEAHAIFDSLQFTEGERVKFWREWVDERLRIHYSYNKMPRSPRKDNKDYINYGRGRGSNNPIRYPKKVRKTAWKRFFKLFPFLKDKT